MQYIDRTYRSLAIPMNWKELTEEEVCEAIVSS